MSHRFARQFSIVCAAGVSAAAFAAPPTLDGTNIPSDFTASKLLATQRFATGFGDHLDPGTSYGGGSELDALYVTNDASYLYIGITGNLENNGNSMMVFIDKNGSAVDDGANPLYTRLFGGPIGNLPRYLNGQNSWNGLDQLTFDAGFSPNFCLGWSGGSPVGSQLRTYYLVNWTELAIGGDLYNHNNTIAGMITDGIPNASGGAGTLGTFLSTGALGIKGASDNSNIDGVEGAVCTTDPNTGFCNFPLAANDPNTATRGFEFAIPLSLLGNPAPGASICLFALVSGTDGYMSNMMLPTAQSETELRNLGGPPFDMGTLSGSQYVCYTIATVGCPISGCSCVDSNGDCKVDLSDLAAVLGVFGQTGANLPGDCSSPIGNVDLSDLALTLSKYGLNCN